MPKIWTKWMQRISSLGLDHDSRGALQRGCGDQEASCPYHSKPQPAWLTPAYLRQRRSGDRITH